MSAWTPGRPASCVCSGMHTGMGIHTQLRYSLVAHRSPVTPTFGNPEQGHRVRQCGLPPRNSQGPLSNDVSFPASATAPEYVTREILTLLRRADLSCMGLYIPRTRLLAPGTPVNVAGIPVQEPGPLARCADFMDAAARRVLPGHLLRRCRVLSSIQLGSSCLQRVGITACTGEEVILNWHMKQTADNMPDSVKADAGYADISDPSSSHTSHVSNGKDSLLPPMHAHQSRDDGRDQQTSTSGTAASWQIESVYRDASDDADQLPPRPQPRAPPEIIIQAQLHALRHGDIVGAAAYNIWGRHASSAGWDLHLAAYKAMLRRPQHHVLLTHHKVEMGTGALPSQRKFMQCVVLHWKTTTQTQTSRLIWSMCMKDNGCWMVESVTAA